MQENKPCPVCKNEHKLKTIVKDDKKIKGCTKCGGMYLHKGELNQMIPHYEGFFPTEDIEFSSIDHDPHSDNHSFIACGYCDNPHMIKVNFLSMSNIILDFCEKCHSIWVDGDELEKIEKYWSKVEKGSVESHDPISIQVLNFLKSVSQTFFKWILPISLMLSTSNIQSNETPMTLKDRLSGLYTSFTGKIEYRTSSGILKKGKISYEYPHKLHLVLADNSVIATNGIYLWIYNPETEICGKQEVAENSGGLIGFLKNYTEIYDSEKELFVFKNDKNKHSEITLKIEKEMIKEMTLKSEELTQTILFSEVKVGTGIKGSLFNFKPPPNSQLVENPLNMLPELPENFKEEEKKEIENID